MAMMQNHLEPIANGNQAFFLSLDVTRKCVVENLDEIQTTGEMKDSPF